MTESNYSLSNMLKLPTSTTSKPISTSCSVKNQSVTYNYSNYVPIGYGTFGTVYKAKCDQTGEDVAIKRVFQDVRYKNRELQILQELNHINVVKLKNYFYTLSNKNANEKKSGAGQYFTPRVLIDVMTELVAPQLGERCNDPACGTFGFMIAADTYVKEHTNELFDLDEDQQRFQKYEAFTGGELVHETHRLALMNAMLHDIEGKIYLCDTLSNQGKVMKDFDVVLTNPPFGTKKGGERANRDDFTFTTSNKQLNFLQHIYRSLKADGKARAAVVLPDNVLFADGEGERIRQDLMDKCNLHTVLRLPTGIFYAQGVKTNVLFFTRGTSDKDNTKEVWFYDLRTCAPVKLYQGPGINY